MHSEKYAIKRLFMAESPKFLHPIGNRGRWTRRWHQILNRKCKCGRFAHAQYKIHYITLIYGGMSEILASYRKSGSRNTMVTLDFTPEVQIWPFCSCAVKIRNITVVIGTLLSLWSFHVAQYMFLVAWNSIESVLKSPKFSHLQGNRGQWINRRCQNVYRNRLIDAYAHAPWKRC